MARNNSRTCKLIEKALEECSSSGDDREPFEDSGSEYNPSVCERTATPSFGVESVNPSATCELNCETSDRNLLVVHSCENLPSVIPDEDISPVCDEIIPTAATRRKSKKRVRCEDTWKRNERKLKRAKGEQYTTVKGKLIEGKCPFISDCACPNKCHIKIDSSQVILLFQKFYELASFDLQNAYLLSLVKIVGKGRIYTNNAQSRRQRTCLYYLHNAEGEEIRVCKKFFLKTFQVSDGRVSRLIKSKAENSVPPKDKRGKSVSVNKTNEEKLEEVKNFIKRFPSYESHYTRHKSENRKYLAPDINLMKLYRLYKDCNANPVSEFIFRKVFNTSFNLSFHPPISDSCKKCDLFENKINYCTLELEKTEIMNARELHQRKADSARDGMRQDTNTAKISEDITVIAFDLMKTLPTPVISTGICYYKRQLWTYCLGIHNLGTNKAHMYVWNESIASRGPQEIGSCLLHYIKEFVTTKKLIMYSDQCGGQNRNIKMSVLCQYIVCSNDYVIEQIDHKFLVSGHSFLPCDQDFGLIEKNKKNFNDIFIPGDWQKVIATARKRDPFQIIEMNSNMFFSTTKLEKNITNRKVNVSKGKIEWLKIQWLQYLKEHPFTFNYKYSNNEDVPFETIDLRKRTSHIIQSLDLLYPAGHVISEPKKKDLLELLQFIPPIHHDFYNSIKTAAVIDTDYVMDSSDE